MTATAPPIRRTESADRRPDAGLPRGFTLAESLVASVVLAMAVVAVSSAVVASQQQTATQEEEIVGVSLGRQLMEEIASLPLSLPDGTPGWPGVTDRSGYDTIDDFNGYTDRVSAPILRTSDLEAAGTFTSAKPQSSIVASGEPDALNPRQYLRTVSISYPTSLFGTSMASGEFAIITVTVRCASGRTNRITRLVADTAVSR